MYVCMYVCVHVHDGTFEFVLHVCMYRSFDVSVVLGSRQPRRLVAGGIGLSSACM
jgi:hypothetical protein